VGTAELRVLVISAVRRTVYKKFSEWKLYPVRAERPKKVVPLLQNFTDSCLA